MKDRMERCGRYALALFTAELCVTGAGRYLMLGPLSPRMLLALLSALCLLPALWREKKQLLWRPENLLVLVFLIYLSGKALQGLLAGNNTAVLSSDVKGFLWLALVPFYELAFKSRQHRRLLADAILTGCALQALFCVVLNEIFAGYSANLLEKVIHTLWAMNWGTILECEYNTFRIFCKSCVFLVPALGLAWSRLLQGRRRLLYVLLFVVYAEALLLTFTRCIYLTAALGLVLFGLLLCRFFPLRRVLLSLIVLGSLTLVFNYGTELFLQQGNLQYAFARCLHFDLNAHLPLPHTWPEEAVDFDSITENTNSTRALTVAGLKELIRRSPLFGNGLGATATQRDGADEYFYLDMLARTGALGLALYLLPYLRALVRFFRRYLRRESCPEDTVLVTGLTAFLIASYFNPWMNAVLGIAWYALSLAAAGEGLPEEKGESVL